MNSPRMLQAPVLHELAVLLLLFSRYYYKSFYSLGKRPPEPPIPQRNAGQPRVSCDEYEHGSCRWYDEWNFEHMIEYERQKYSLV